MSEIFEIEIITEILKWSIKFGAQKYWIKRIFGPKNCVNKNVGQKKIGRKFKVKNNGDRDLSWDLIFETFQTPSRHLSDPFRTFLRQPSDTLHTLPRHSILSRPGRESRVRNVPE